MSKREPGNEVELKLTTITEVPRHIILVNRTTPRIILSRKTFFDQLEAESFMTNQRQDSSGQSELHFKRKINGKKVTRRFDDSMSSLSNAKEISMNW